MLNYILLPILVAWLSGAYAHSPDHAVFKAFQFPGGMEPEIDGSLADWSLVGKGYEIGNRQFTDLVRDAEIEPEDMFAQLWVGWSPKLNKVYVAARVRDDVHQIDRPVGSAATKIFTDDALEVFFDVDHSGGQYANFTELTTKEALSINGSTANHFVMAGPSPDDVFFVNYSAASWYALVDGPYTEAAVSHVGRLGEAGVTEYELAVTPFSRVDMGAAFLSIEHSLAEGEVIGFNVEFDDFDGKQEIMDAKWSLSGKFNSYRFAEHFSDLELMPLDRMFVPTLVLTEMSWAAIKAENWGD
ncbi:MAG: hypothetical protein VX294_08810 [Candidatus Latescibacterota bacterium]|nr:hypothetical protein [Candidatus Latescibacterota bacterium]